MRTGKFDISNLGEPQPRLRGGEDWREESLCRVADPDLFIDPDVESDEERIERESIAKDYCISCEVREICLAVAVANRDTGGVFGGMNDEERKVFIKKKKQEEGKKAAQAVAS